MTSTPQLAHVVPGKNHRFHCLDGLRGVAAILIVFFHLPSEMYSKLRGPNAYLAVDLFFLLSGFVIAFSYEGRLQKGMRWSDFFAARVIRLWPIYLIGTAIGALHQIVLPHVGMSLATLAKQTALALFMLPDLHKQTHGSFLYPLDFPAWSLFFEMIANLLYAALVKQGVAKTSGLIGLCTISLASLTAWAWRTGNINAGSDAGTFWGGFARVGFGFFLGVLLFRAYQRWLQHRNILATKGPLLAIATTIVTIVALMTPMASSPIRQVLTVTIIFPAVVLFGSLSRLPSSWKPLMVLLGEISFPVYLLHIHFVSLLQLHVIQNLFQRSPSFPSAILFALFCALLPLSWLLNKIFDLPVRRFLTHSYNSLFRATELQPTLRSAESSPRADL
ncbi:acyltransferase family protein [Granulicella cerasi]|uniref:Acyltransferase family protein n=1 Tax=Granulicella cerasi TaxID=741063 RepID=A0ABW1Z7R0_9BACT|nr:acyltransferase [Granulicella cerasi]